MAALPVIPLSSTDLIQNGGSFFVEGGPAEGIYAFASTDGYPAEGGSAQPVYVVSDAEASARGATGGTKRLMKQVARGSRPTIGGAARPVYVLGGAFDPTTVAFLPSQIAGLSLWLDAADASTLFQDSALTTPAAADNDPVGGWRDKSGAGNKATGATTARPTLKLAIVNGKPILRFNGTTNGLTSAAVVTMTNPATVFIVGNQTSKATQAFFLDSDIGGARQNASFNTSGFVQITAGALLNDAIDHSAGFRVLEAVINGASTLGLVNGTQTASGNAGANAGSALVYIGNGNLLAFATADMAEVLYYGALLSAAQRSQVRAYLGSKWGVAVV